MSDLESGSDPHLLALESLDDGIWIADPDGEITYLNPAAKAMEGRFWSRAGQIGTLEDVVFSPTMLDLVRTQGRLSAEFQLSGGDTGSDDVQSVVMEMRLLSHEDGRPAAVLFHGRDISREWTREQMLQDRHIELEQAYHRVKQTQSQLLQSEKLASIGQLAAGVAHEINNPIGYLHSNMGTLQTYLRGLFSLLDVLDRLLQEPTAIAAASEDAARIRRQIDYDFVRQDLPQLLSESREGIERVRKIVLDLRDFSHAGLSESEDWTQADIHRGLESTLNIVWSELKYKAQVVKRFGELPSIECMPQQLNQVFMNLLINAGQAIVENGHIEISTHREGDEICISISDDGVGIPADKIKRIFDPFYTTKAVGKGTGLGLALSYGIVQKHHGRIDVESVEGQGATFRVYLPIRRAPAA